MNMRGTFDTRFQTESEDIFFLHDIDQDARTLRVQVLNYGLSSTFSHRQLYANDRKQLTLGKKTSGFLAAVTASQKRVVLAWAESGHGIGRRGDQLEAGRHVLGNARWASRAVALAKILDINLTSPFDKATTPNGSFQAAHVEVKLATHAVVLLLKLSRAHIADSSGSALTRENLARLRQLQWRDGSPIHFQVFVSRRNCPRCGTFLSRLQELTGVRFDLKSGTRVVPIQYHQQQLKAAARLGLGRSPSAEGGKRKTASTTTTTTKLQTYEENGVVHYVTPQTSHEEAQTSATIRIPIRVSPHHLSDVDKPLPATPVTEAPDFGCSASQDLNADDVPGQLSNEEYLPFPRRSPRPYGMSFQ
ncbi:hypothetical protein LLEC1_03786 [Akanthomyces lecanii]|uniref:Uncharacterized protein n=1 Tax=Cordyceps confragosa TaxID=2714763 RepID=A0A179I2M1_CORDF|nr:hypothetical protein LLEC1_03786 [Akanthomyces lecanii]